MGLFGKQDRRLQESLRSFETALEDLSTCCSNNGDAVRRLDREQNAVRADVDLQWEKVNRALSRFAKRDAVAEKVNGPDGSDDLNERIRRGDPI